MSIMRSRLTLIVAFVLVIFLSFGSMAFGLEGDYGSIISPTAFADETPDIFDTDINVDEIGENSEAMTLIDKIRNAANVRSEERRVGKERKCTLVLDQSSNK